jgi:hypothetical protein
MACVKQLDQISEHEKNQEDQQQQIDVDQNKHQYGVGDGNVGTKGNNPILHQCEYRHGNNNADADDQLPLATIAFTQGKQWFFRFILSAEDHEIL